MESAIKPNRTFKGRAFMVFGYIAMAMQAFNLYLFINLIGK